MNFAAFAYLLRLEIVYWVMYPMLHGSDLQRRVAIVRRR